MKCVRNGEWHENLLTDFSSPCTDTLRVDCTFFSDISISLTDEWKPASDKRDCARSAALVAFTSTSKVKLIFWLLFWCLLKGLLKILKSKVKTNNKQVEWKRARGELKQVFNFSAECRVPSRHRIRFVLLWLFDRSKYIHSYSSLSLFVSILTLLLETYLDAPISSRHSPRRFIILLNPITWFKYKSNNLGKFTRKFDLLQPLYGHRDLVFSRARGFFLRFVVHIRVVHGNVHWTRNPWHNVKP